MLNHKSLKEKYRLDKLASVICCNLINWCQNSLEFRKFPFHRYLHIATATLVTKKQIPQPFWKTSCEDVCVREEIWSDFSCSRKNEQALTIA